MIAPYLFHLQPDEGHYRLWVAGTDRAGVFRLVNGLRVVTDDPNAWVESEAALDALGAGLGAISKIVGRLKQLDNDEAIAWQEIRDERNERLAASDWARTAPQLSEQLRELYAGYQQALRDLPGVFPSPYEVVWPDEPTEDDVTGEPDWLPMYNRIKTLAQSAVGVDLGELDNLQIKALLAVLLHEHHAFGNDGTIRPLGEWVTRRV